MRGEMVGGYWRIRLDFFLRSWIELALRSLWMYTMWIVERIKIRLIVQLYL